VIWEQMVHIPLFFFCNQTHPPFLQSFSTLTVTHERHVRPIPFPEIAQLFWSLQVFLLITDVHDEHLFDLNIQPFLRQDPFLEKALHDAQPVFRKKTQPRFTHSFLSSFNTVHELHVLFFGPFPIQRQLPLTHFFSFVKVPH